MKCNQILFTMSCVVLMVGFQNCGTQYNLKMQDTPSSSESLSPTAVTPTGTPPTNTPPEQTYSVKVQNFNSQTSTKPVDMVWVFDNSASMSEEASHVRQNFNKFIARLKMSSDIRVAMISSTQPNDLNTQVYLPQGTDANNIEVNYFIDSYNSLLVAAASTCKANEQTGLCAKLRSQSRYSRVMGKLDSFFRPAASKVFVFVTDDDSSGQSQTTTIQVDNFPKGYIAYSKTKLVENEHYITGSTFLSRMDEYFGASSPYRLFGFVAKTKTDTNCAYRESKVYKSIIASKSGDSFDICDKDWSKHFDALANNILTYAQTEYVLSNVDLSKLKRVVSVTLNGRMLEFGKDYAINGKQISIQAALLANESIYSIEVAYEVWN